MNAEEIRNQFGHNEVYGRIQYGGGMAHVESLLPMAIIAVGELAAQMAEAAERKPIDSSALISEIWRIKCEYIMDDGAHAALGKLMSQIRDKSGNPEYKPDPAFPPTTPQDLFIALQRLYNDVSRLSEADAAWRRGPRTHIPDPPKEWATVNDSLVYARKIMFNFKG